MKAVVWDIGNVFALWEPEAHYDRLIGPDRRARLFAEANLHEMNEAIDLGTHSRDAAYSHAEKFPEWRAEIRRWHDDWTRMFSTPVPGTSDLMLELNATGARSVALSNFGANTLAAAKEYIPALNTFAQEFVSAHLGVVKPYPAIYAALEDGTGLSGEALIFTDDRAENIEVAAERGWKTHLFQGAGDWRDRLVAEGMLPER
ncbi:MAG: HAD-IA family hydrolase [Silicimonas sp.]|nr:HAD-IA family hydrolase [Silicimonas sp.]